MSQLILDPESEFGQRLIDYHKKLWDGTASQEEILEMNVLAREKMTDCGYRYSADGGPGKYRLISSKFSQLKGFQEQGIEFILDVASKDTFARPSTNQVFFSVITLFDERSFRLSLRHEIGHLVSYNQALGTVDNLEALARTSVIRTPKELSDPRDSYNTFDTDELYQGWGDMEEVVKALFTRKKVKGSLKKIELTRFNNLRHVLNKITLNMNNASHAGIESSNSLFDSFEEADLEVYDGNDRTAILIAGNNREIYFGRFSNEPANPYVVQIPFSINDKKGLASYFVNNPGYVDFIDRLIDGKTIAPDPKRILANCFFEKVLPQLLIHNRDSCHSNVALQVLQTDLSQLRDPLNIQGHDWRTVDSIKEFMSRASLLKGYDARGINLEPLYGRIVEMGSAEVMRKFG